MTLQDWVRTKRATYLKRVERLRKVTSAMRPTEVLAFVLFTPQQRYEIAVREWREWMKGQAPRGNMWVTRRRWLKQMPHDSELRMGREEALKRDWHSYVQRLVLDVPGLAFAKAPFFASLMYPTAPDVPVCLDVHVLRMLGFDWDSKLSIESWKFYDKSQKRMQQRARIWRMPAFAYQWCAWDFVRAGGPPVRETFIERDLDMSQEVRL